MILADRQDKPSSSYQQGKQNTGDERNNPMQTWPDLFRAAPFCAAPRPNQKRSLSILSVPSSALLCGGRTMLATAVDLPARRAPSPQIRARDTSLYGTTNGTAGINRAPNVGAGINGPFGADSALGIMRMAATAPIIESLPSISLPWGTSFP